MSDEEIDCIYYGDAGWTSNPLSDEVPFEQCSICPLKKECKAKDLIQQEKLAIERATEKEYDEELSDGR